MRDMIPLLQGQVILAIRGMKAGSDRVEIICTDLSRVTLYHVQDCCEHVELVEVIGNPADLIGQRIVLAEVTTQQDDNAESATWTFYRFRSHGGDVTLRWVGESNGYYSERVDEAIDTVSIDDLEPVEQVLRDSLLERGLGRYR